MDAWTNYLSWKHGNGVPDNPDMLTACVWLDGVERGVNQEEAYEREKRALELQNRQFSALARAFRR